MNSNILSQGTMLIPSLDSLHFSACSFVPNLQNTLTLVVTFYNFYYDSLNLECLSVGSTCMDGSHNIYHHRNWSAKGHVMRILTNQQAAWWCNALQLLNEKMSWNPSMGTPFVQPVTVLMKYIDSEIQIQKVLGFIQSNKFLWKMKSSIYNMTLKIKNY